jgi:hypothetical protein
LLVWKNIRIFVSFGDPQTNIQEQDLAMTNFTSQAIMQSQAIKLQQGETKDDEKESDYEDEDLDKDPEGVQERGFAHFTQSLPVIYL